MSIKQSDLYFKGADGREGVAGIRGQKVCILRLNRQVSQHLIMRALNNVYGKTLFSFSFCSYVIEFD